MDSPRSMKIFGYPRDRELESPMAMAEVTFVADPRTLRELARFLNHAADLMDKHGADFGHEHFSDFTDDGPNGGPDVIVNG
jgi:hypothetical protein